LRDEAAAGRFRTDLLARIEMPRIDLEPLRERRVDIPILFAHFLERAARASGSVAKIFREPSAEAPPLPMSFVLALLSRAWPKNIRELEKFAVSAELAYRTRGGWPSPDAQEEPERAPPSEPVVRRVRPSAEELAKLLDQHDFIARRVAEALGVSRTSLDKWMRELGIRRPSDIGLAEIEAARARFQGDMPSTAAALRISVRGLKLRLHELRLPTS
jgi:two-component system C4-dicarboxylate transport response regulator DctD